MARNSLAFSINAGYIGLLLVLLVLGGVAIVGVNQLSGSLQALSDGSSEARRDISRTIEKFAGVRQAMDSLKGAQAGFDRISRMQDNLAQSSQATAEIGERLKSIEGSFEQQMETLGSISNSTQLIAQEIESSLKLVHQTTRAAEEINRRVLSSYIAFFNYLNEYASDVDSALEDIATISTRLGEIRELIPRDDDSEGVYKNLDAVGSNLRRYRYYMAELGETTSVTQIDELKSTLMQYGQKITGSAQDLRDAVWQYAEAKADKTLDLSSATARSAASAVDNGKADQALIGRSVELSLDSSKRVGDINTQLADAIVTAGQGLAQVPQAVERVSNAVAGLGKVTEALDSSTRIANRSRDRSRTMSFAVVVVCIFAIGLGIAIAWFVNQRLIRPLGRFTRGLHQVAQRDLTVRVDSAGASGELKTLIDGNNKLVADLRSSIQSMKDLAGEVLGNAHRVDQMTESISGALNEQSARTTTIASSMEQLEASVSSVSGSAEQASHAAKDGDQEATKGREMIGQTIDSISELATQIGQVVDSMGALKKDSENITSILDVIRGVADQTNLLALNASIEAARAGDHGRGFAVVADEVRMLAHRTNEASINIQDLIQGLQARSARVTQVVDNGASLLETTIDGSKQAGLAFEQVADAISQISQMNLAIVGTLEHQADATRAVSENLSGINQLSEQSAEGARSSAAASEELAKAAESLEKVVGVYQV